MNTPVSDTELHDYIRRLPRHQQPGRDLWPGIDQAINAPRPQRRGQRFALAASVLLLIGASLYFGQVQPRLQQSAQVENLILSLADEHDRNKQALLVRYEDSRPAYANWDSQMRQLEQAEQVIYNALREEPGNMELLRILRQVQQKQLKLIDAAYSPRVDAI